MIRDTKKSSFILGLLIIAFFAVSLSLVIDMSSITVPPKPPVDVIEGHRDVFVTHGTSVGVDSLGCADCHYGPVHGDCTDDVCHPSPDYWLGDNNSIYFSHHDLAYSGSELDCWSSECHDPGTDEDPYDIRYVKEDLVGGDTWQDWHVYCETCHLNVHSMPP